MTSRVESISEAFEALGLEPDAGLPAAKSAFRARVKTLHPDVNPPTPESLSELVRIVSAMEFIEAHRPVCLEIEVSAREALYGVTRTLRSGEKPLLVRIPPGTRHGASVGAVGEPAVQVTVKVMAERNAHTAPPGALFENDELDAFMHEFSRPSVGARLAKWIRKAQSAA